MTDRTTDITRLKQLLRAGDHAAALPQLDRLIAAAPAHAPLHWHRARCLEGLRRPEEALAAVERVLELRPDYAPAWLKRAELSVWVCEDYSDYDTDVRRALALDPGLTAAREALARWPGGADAAVRAAPAAPAGEQPADRLAVDIAEQLYAAGNEPVPVLLPVDPAVYSRDQRRFAAAAQRQLERLGFELLGNFEPFHLRERIGRPTLVRVYRSEDAGLCAASFRLAPKWPGWPTFLLLAVLGQWRRPAVIDLESGFDDGGFVITNNGGGIDPFGYGGAIDLEQLPARTEADALLRRHSERIAAYRRAHPRARLRRLTSVDDLFRLQRDLRDAKNAYRRSIGYVQPEELRRLLGRHHDRLADRVRAELARLIALDAQQPA